MSRASSVVILVLLAGLGIGATYLVQRTSAPRIAAEQRLIDSRKLLDLLPPAIRQSTTGTAACHRQHHVGQQHAAGWLPGDQGRPAERRLAAQPDHGLRRLDRIVIAIDLTASCWESKPSSNRKLRGWAQRLPNGPIPGSRYLPENLEATPMTQAGR